MELILDKTYEFIGKTENINKGAHFRNTTIVTREGERVNIKLEQEQLERLELGHVYRFETKAVPRTEEDTVLRCLSLEPIEAVYKDKELEALLDHFYDYAPMPMMAIKKEVEGYMARIENPVLAEVTKMIYAKNERVFYLHPAATKFHHAYVGGLSYHTLTMLRMVDPFLAIYPFLNRDLLYAGTILHDMSKIDEISGVDGEYTTEGQLIGHLVMQTIAIDEAARKLGYEKTEEVLLLKHMILSHHGQYHFGSPKKPQTGEALLLWHLDTIDSKMTVLGETLEQTLDGSFTQMVSVLDRMRFYKSRIKKEEKK
ncbi:MAG: metal-dependent phosphohydrolase [Acholeplasmataceae bacterium]